MDALWVRENDSSTMQHNNELIFDAKLLLYGIR